MMENTAKTQLYRLILCLGFSLYSAAVLAEPLNVKLGLWRVEPTKASNSSAKQKLSCITKESLEKTPRPFMSHCTQTLLNSNGSSAEWEIACENGKNTRWKMLAISPEQIESSSTPVGTVSKNAQVMKSQAKWVSADCGDVKAVFPAVK